MTKRFTLFGYVFTVSIRIEKKVEFVGSPMKKPSYIWHAGDYYKVSSTPEESDCTGRYNG